MKFFGRGTGPRRLEWEDDGVTVPWLSSGLAVYLVAMLNMPFWRRASMLIPPVDLHGALFHGALFALLTSVYACVLCLITVRGPGRALLIVSVLCASFGQYLLDNFGVSLLWMVRNGAEWKDYIRLPVLWQIGLLGVAPAVLLAKVRIGRRHGVRELLRRLRFCLLCLALAACVLVAQHRRLAVFFTLDTSAFTLLNPVNVVRFASVRNIEDMERLFSSHWFATPPEIRQ